ncbi:MAG: DMT family transporter, partial [Silicimonas sp.]
FRAVLLFVATFCFIAAIRVMPLADALAIVFVAPFIVLLVGKFHLGEDVGPRRVGAAIVGFVGVLFVIQPSFAAFGAVALFPLGTAVGFAFYILVTRGLSRQVHPVTLQFYTGMIASLFCMPIMMLAERSGSELFDPVWPAGIAWLRLLPRRAPKARHNHVPAAPVSQRRAARSWRRVSAWVELSWSVRSALCRAGRSSLLFRVLDRGQFVRSNDIDDSVRIYTGPMISALHPTLARSAWTRTVFRYGITALALLMFLLALRRSG